MAQNNGQKINELITLYGGDVFFSAFMMGLRTPLMIIGLDETAFCALIDLALVSAEHDLDTQAPRIKAMVEATHVR